MSEVELLRRAGQVLADRGLGQPAAALVLGSGLAGFARQLEQRVELAFSEVPHWPVPAVSGHGGQLVVGEVEGIRVACLTGRAHLYEGRSPADIVRPVRTLCLAGVHRFVLTNAAGGISPRLFAGDVMLVRDHLNRTGCSPLVGPEEAELGPRFPDQSEVYSRRLSALLELADPDLVEGVYAGNLGPQYETPAEVRALAHAGADAVGMSTVLEAIALTAMGAEVAAVSLISNPAAGIATAPLDHDEVLAAGQRAAVRLTALLGGFCRLLGREVGGA